MALAVSPCPGLSVLSQGHILLAGSSTSKQESCRAHKLHTTLVLCQSKLHVEETVMPTTTKRRTS